MSNTEDEVIKGLPDNAYKELKRRKLSAYFISSQTIS